MGVATREEIVDYLAAVPSAHPAWADALFVAKLPMSAVDRLFQTMAAVPGSPLRTMEDGLLSKEIARVNGVFGDLKDGARGNGRVVVHVEAVLTREESLRLNAVVGNFCQPEVSRSRRFGHNGHAVANAARRCATGYEFSRVGKLGRVIEVGPDVKHWLTDVKNREWKVDGVVEYVGARPVIDRRDAVRVAWKNFAHPVRGDAGSSLGVAARQRAVQLDESYEEVFPGKRVQDLDVKGDFILSFDANYDVGFADMPRVMERTGARGWYGYMNRAKGLTRSSKLMSGKLESMGFTYRVNWEAGRIDFRHPECNAFGYSHNVWELMKYEECNGFVWTTQKANYVYAKGPETNDELLFFSVARVPLAAYMQQPSYVPNVEAGRMRVSSVWAVGGWSNGVPTRFEPVNYTVDAKAFASVFEKRMAVDVRGDFSQTLTLAKSTNVRLWINGTPVGTDRKIATQLIEATAVAIEVMAAQERAKAKLVFSKAMGTYEVVMQKQPWFMRVLESVVDMRNICGSIVGPVARSWEELRGGLLDVALSPMSEFKIAVSREPEHFLLPSVERAVFGDVCIPESSTAPSVPAVPSADEFVQATRLASESGTDESTDVRSVSSQESESTVATEVSEVVNRDVSGGVKKEDREEYKAMEEYVSLEQYLRRALHTEVRIDAGRLKRSACVSSAEVLQNCTTRTQHTLVKFQAHREVRQMGFDNPDYGAIYSIDADRFFPVTRKGSLAVAAVLDGWYYTCNHMKVWNLEAILESIEYAMTYGSLEMNRKLYDVTLGVPGAGKTYTMMRRLAKEYAKGHFTFFVLSVTKKASEAAIREGLEAGMPRQLLERRVRTLDSFLINDKGSADVVAIDEFPMAHSGKIDAAVAITGAKDIRMYGDGRQIPYDPFTAGHAYDHASYGGSLDDKRTKFMHVSHRLNEDACAAWVDVYPSIQSCTCCRTEEKDKKSMSWSKAGTLAGYLREDGVRYHTYTRADLDEVKSALHIRGDRDVLKKLENSGLSTVHEDQGATHNAVVSFRATADYDKKASAKNPSLFNRLSYVLTDMTRHKQRYEYVTVSTERDAVVGRVECSQHAWRRRMVRTGESTGLTSVDDMLCNRYHADIVSGKTLSETYC